MKQSKRYLALLLGLVMLLAALTACGRKNDDAQPPEESTPPVETAEAAEETAAPERADGERFEDVITIEGMEETIQLEHVINETAGFAMDYDYEGFVRRSEADRERFIWSYDDPEKPENFVEVSYSAENAQTVADTIEKELSESYEVYRDTTVLSSGCECIRMDASAVAGGANTADVIQAVYVIPAADGCRVARIQYIPEGSDGFGIRLAYLVNTITVMDARSA